MKNSGSVHTFMGNLRKTSTFPAGHSFSPGGMFMAKLFQLELKITREILTAH